jgi:ectoine hydroxylase-related dioxygenase (phytanoyl-CoA dioxygenase family)
MPIIESIHGAAARFTQEGFAILPSGIDPRQITTFRDASSQLAGHAHRNLLAFDWARNIAASPEIRALVEPTLGHLARPVRGILFDKLPSANWKVPWHQDLSIAVAQRLDVAGFGPWSVKEGVTHVQPPVELLQNMLTVRLHLDDCQSDNGPLRVLPGSHRLGVLDAKQIASLRTTTAESVCTCNAGDVVLMRPLLLHASSAAQKVGHRRVVHIEFAATELPWGLRWAF